MFVPCINLEDASQASLYSSLSFFGSVILQNSRSVEQIQSLVNQTGSTLYWAYANSVDQAVQLWDVGVLKVILPLDIYQTHAEELAVIVSEDRLAVVADSAAVLQSVKNVSTLIVKNAEGVEELAKSTAGLLCHGGERTVVLDTEHLSVEDIKQYGAKHIDVIVSASRLTTTLDDSSKLNIAECFLASAKTDRADGLYTTMVVDEFNKALGLVYSSKQSVAESIRLGQGVYQSRGRGLWHKGLTSGATQTLKHIDYDCDGDALRFVVEQHGAGKQTKARTPK
jgi:phosphoribosyl-ATP pyrophosphohydrolase/phosphoribosyl-AMP cyclohydrolase/histidinol dehydrogenase